MTEFTEKELEIVDKNLTQGWQTLLVKDEQEMYQKFRSKLDDEQWDSFINAVHEGPSTLDDFLSENYHIYSLTTEYIEEVIYQYYLIEEPLNIIKETAGGYHSYQFNQKINRKFGNTVLPLPMIDLFTTNTLPKLSRGLEKALLAKASEFKYLMKCLLKSKIDDDQDLRDKAYNALEKLLKNAPSARKFIVDNKKFFLKCIDTYKDMSSANVVKEVDTFLLEFDFYVYHVLETVKKSDPLIEYPGWVQALGKLDKLLLEEKSLTGGLFQNGKLNRDPLPNLLFKHYDITITIFSSMRTLINAGDYFVMEFKEACEVINVISDYQSFAIWAHETSDKELSKPYKMIHNALLDLFENQDSKIIERKRTAQKFSDYVSRKGHQTKQINQAQLVRRCMWLREDGKLLNFPLKTFRFLAKNWGDPSMKREKISKTHARLSITNTTKDLKFKKVGVEESNSIAISLS